LVNEVVHTRKSGSPGLLKLNQTNPTTLGSFLRYEVKEVIHEFWHVPRGEAVWAMTNGFVAEPGMVFLISSRYGPIACAGVSYTLFPGHAVQL
jgi:hypothetical protein